MSDFCEGDKVVVEWPKNEGGFSENAVFVRRFKHPYRVEGHDDCAEVIVDELATDEGPDDGIREVEVGWLRARTPADDEEE